MQRLRETAEMVLGLMVWGIFIYGPLMLLPLQMPWLVIAASSVSLSLFALSFRWRKGFVFIIGCLGMVLVIQNTFTIASAMTQLAREAGLSGLLRFLLGALSIPFVGLLIFGVDRLATLIFVPAKQPSTEPKASSGEIG